MEKSSTKLIYEEQTDDKNEIRIYDLVEMKLIFQANGFIWGHSMEYFDQAHGTVIFFRNSSPGQWDNFDLLTLNIDTLEIKLISSVKTSGDPYTGFPEIQAMDRVKREILLTFETKDFKTEKLRVGY